MHLPGPVIKQAADGVLELGAAHDGIFAEQQAFPLDEYADARSEKYAAMVDRIRRRLSLTSLRYQELDDLVEAIGLPKEKLCTFCWDGCEGCRQTEMWDVKYHDESPK